MIATMKEGLISIIPNSLEEADILSTWIDDGCAFHVDWNGYRAVLDQLAGASGVAQ